MFSSFLPYNCCKVLTTVKPVYLSYSQRQSVDAGCEGSLLGEGVADEAVEQGAHQPHHRLQGPHTVQVVPGPGPAAGRH